MLKSELAYLLIVLLLVDAELPKWASIALAVLAGLSIKTGSELYKGSFTQRKFLIRLLLVFGLSIAVMFIWHDYKIETNIVYAIMAVTLFSELIVMLVMKYGEIIITKYFKKYDE